VVHYHRLLCAGFCAQSDWAEFATLFDSRSKDSAEFLILPNPKCSFVGSIKSHAVPFKHDALPDKRVVSRTQEPAATFPDPDPRSCYPLVIILFCE
jgi:hypothetical protein